MAEKEIRIHNKSDRPDNVIKKENDIYLECEELENQLPKFLRRIFFLPERKRASVNKAGLSA